MTFTKWLHPHHSQEQLNSKKDFLFLHYMPRKVKVAKLDGPTHYIPVPPGYDEYLKKNPAKAEARAKEDKIKPKKKW